MPHTIFMPITFSFSFCRVSAWDCTYAQVVLESHWEHACKNSEPP